MGGERYFERAFVDDPDWASPLIISQNPLLLCRVLGAFGICARQIAFDGAAYVQISRADVLTFAHNESQGSREDEI